VIPGSLLHWESGGAGRKTEWVTIAGARLPSHWLLVGRSPSSPPAGRYRAGPLVPAVRCPTGRSRNCSPSGARRSGSRGPVPVGAAMRRCWPRRRRRAGTIVGLWRDRQRLARRGGTVIPSHLPYGFELLLTAEGRASALGREVRDGLTDRRARIGRETPGLRECTHPRAIVRRRWPRRAPYRCVRGGE
jgi:hypothetical protein